MSTTGFIYVSFPLAMAIAASIRVGNLLGSGQPSCAMLSSQVAVVHSIGFMAVLAVAQYILKDQIGWVYSNDQEVVTLVSSLVHITALFAIVDGLQSALSGVFRGMARQRYVVLLNLLGFWGIGLPVGVALTFFVGGGGGHEGNGIGIGGVYWGLTAGLTATGIIGMVLMSRTDWERMSREAQERVSADAKTDGGDTTLSAIIRDDGCSQQPKMRLPSELPPSPPRNDRSAAVKKQMDTQFRDADLGNNARVHLEPASGDCLESASGDSLLAGDEARAWRESPVRSLDSWNGGGSLLSVEGAGNGTASPEWLRVSGISSSIVRPSPKFSPPKTESSEQDGVMYV